MILALDVGGTHADGVLLVKNENDYSLFASEKIPLAGRGVKEAVINLLNELTDKLKQASNPELERAVISTTLATNAIAEGKAAPVGLILIPGPGINAEYFQYGDANKIINGYTDHRGEIVQNISRQEIISAGKEFSKQDIKDIAIAGKFSVRNPQQEIQAKNWLQESDLNFSSISLGHKLSPGLNFARRAATVCCNAAIKNLQNQFKQDIKKVLDPYIDAKSLYFLKSDGGTMKAGDMEKYPIKAVNSGPAASIMGGMSYLAGKAKENLKQTSLLLDIGGTTTDIALFVQGTPLFEPGGIKVKGWNTLVRGLFSRSAAVGGDSKITVEAGDLKVGPAREGPAAVLGGPELTPTDAVLLLREKGILARRDKLIPDVEMDMREIKQRFCKLAEKLQVSRDRQDSRHKSELDINKLADMLTNFEFAGADDTVEADSEAGDDPVSNLETSEKVALLSLERMVQKISRACEEILAELSDKPVYTIEELLQDLQIKPAILLGMGGPARAIAPAVAEKLNLQAEIVPSARVANAIGAGCARPTYAVTVRADTKTGKVVIPGRGIRRDIKAGEKFNADTAVEMARDLIREDYPGEITEIEVTNRESFPTVSGFRTTGEIMEVQAQVKPGLAGSFSWSEGADSNESH